MNEYNVIRVQIDVKIQEMLKETIVIFAIQSETAVTGVFPSEQILLFALTEYLLER